jgi:hypothetical protein
MSITARLTIVGVLLALVGVFGFFLIGANRWPWYAREPLRLAVLLAPLVVPWVLSRRYRRAGMR